MDNNLENIFNKNKKIIFICLILIIISIIFMNFVNNKNYELYEYKEDELIEKFEANQFVPVYVTEYDMAEKYLNDFKNIMLNDLKKAYELLNVKYKNVKYGSFEKFESSIKEEYSLAFASMSVKEYSVVKRNKKRYYYIRNNRDDLYIFKENSIMDYEVFLDNYTVEIK